MCCILTVVSDGLRQTSRLQFWPRHLSTDDGHQAQPTSNCRANRQGGVFPMGTPISGPSLKDCPARTPLCPAGHAFCWGVTHCLQVPVLCHPPCTCVLCFGVPNTQLGLSESLVPRMQIHTGLIFINIVQQIHFVSDRSLRTFLGYFLSCVL